MANTVENTLSKIGTTIENIMGWNKIEQPSTNGQGSGQASNLELYGKAMRDTQLFQNEWRKDNQYSRVLVNAEYMIQTEFKINGGESVPTEKDTRTKDQKKIDKLEQKKQKIQDKIDKLEGKKSQPKENITRK